MTDPAVTAERADALHPHSAEEAIGWVGHKLDDLGGDPVGRVEEILAEPESNTPSWLLVKVGRIGGRRTAVPFDFAAAGVGHVWVPYPKETIRAAPAVSRGKGLEPELEAELRRHYGISATGGDVASATAAEAQEPAAGGDAEPPEPGVESGAEPAGAETGSDPEAPEADAPGSADGAQPAG